MTAMEMLTKAKQALNLSISDYDDDLKDLILAAEDDLRIAGIRKPGCDDPLYQRAVITYVRTHFGSPNDYDRVKASYDEQKAQLQMATGYTDWGDEYVES